MAVSASNYLIFVLGLTDLLSAVGVYYELSRIIAACCEAVYLYCMMRWVVFRDTEPPGAGGTSGRSRRARAHRPRVAGGRGAGSAGTTAHGRRAARRRRRRRYGAAGAAADGPR